MNPTDATGALEGLPHDVLPARRAAAVETLRPHAGRLAAEAPIVCFSHLRWDFVYQRPQHLLSRFGRQRAVLFIEEPVAGDGPPRLERHEVAPNVSVIVPRLPANECACDSAMGIQRQRALLTPLMRQVAALAGQPPILWFYTPMSFAFAQGFESRLVVYDCMDELSNFRFAPAGLVAAERALMARADLVFTGGHSLHEAKREQHRHVFVFPSSVDLPHFARARHMATDPADMAGIAGPRIGYYGVIDERIDLELLAHAARARPDWQWIMLGPVVKIDPAGLPQGPNLHYLGAKRYEDLPSYLGRWDAAMMPFALNDSTRFISPTKTPEYLAGGCAVASTPIVDVIRSWGTDGPVYIGQGADGFIAAVRSALLARARSEALCARADRLLHGMSWERTFAEMNALMIERIEAAQARPTLARRASGLAWTA